MVLDEKHWFPYGNRQHDESTGYQQVIGGNINGIGVSSSDVCHNGGNGLHDAIDGKTTIHYPLTITQVFYWFFRFTVLFNPFHNHMK